MSVASHGEMLNMFFSELSLGSSYQDDSSSFTTHYQYQAECRTNHIAKSLESGAPCQPRDKVIRVPLPNNTVVDQLTPTHVSVRRCSGLCSHSPSSKVSCTAIRTEVREVSVMLGVCPLSGGKCEKQCAVVRVEDELECECG